MTSPRDIHHSDLDDSGPPERLWLFWFHRLSVVAVAAFVAGVVLLAVPRGAPRYESSAEVALVPLENKGGPVYQAGPNLEPARRIATSAPVIEGARRRLGLETTELVPPVSVTTPFAAYTLVFSGSATTAPEAQALVAAYTDSYLDVRYQEVLEERAAKRKPIQERITALSEEADVLYRELAGAPPHEQQGLSVRYASVLEQIKALGEERDRLANPDRAQVVQLLQRATLPREAVGSGRIKVLMLAGFLGLAGGFGQVLVRTAVVPRLHGRHSLAAETGAPVLALVPRPGGMVRRLRTGADGPQWEEVHLLASTVLRLFHDGRAELLVTSANPREGKSSIATQLSLALIGAGVRTELRTLRRQEGRSSWFRDGHRRKEGLALVDDARAGLWGAASSNPEEAENQERSVVVVDGSSILRESESLRLAPRVDGVILVAVAGRTTTASIHEAARRLGQVGATIVGNVLVDVTPSRIWFERRFTREPYRSTMTMVPDRSGAPRWARRTRAQRLGVEPPGTTAS